MRGEVSVIGWRGIIFLLVALEQRLKVNRRGKREAILLWTVISHLQGWELTLVRREPGLSEP
jgi:hypothetical protein